MALVTMAYPYGLTRQVQRHSDESAPNTTLTVEVPAGNVRRLVEVLVKYSSTPVHAGIKIDLDSGLGASWNVQLAISAINQQTFIYSPSNDFYLGDDDALIVTAPAGGGAVTSAIAVYTETLS